MPIQKCKPTSPGRRFVEKVVHDHLHKGAPYAPLVEAKKRTGGRNNNGHITTRHVGGGHKQNYRLVDFKRNKDGVIGIVKAVEYDPNRTANIALIQYVDGIKTYIIAPKGIEVGQQIESGVGSDIKIGNAMPLANIPVGTVIHNIETKPGKGGQLIRSAGTSAQVLGQEGKYTLVRLNSSEVRLILSTCRATIGSVGNEQHELINIGKAGRNRWLGKRPTVRGSVMNPNDHPHGGGEGKSPIGRKAPVTPWGKPALGYKTRSKKAKSSKLIVRGRKK